MGIGRRDFLKLFGASLASLAFTASPAVAILGEYYVNRKLGIAFKKYPGWSFANGVDLGEIKNGQILDMNDADLARYIKENTDIPLLTISKFPISVDGGEFTPGINIWLDYYDRSKIDKLKESMKMVNTDILVNSKILKEFVVLSEPITRFVSKCDSVEYVSSFLFEHEN